MMSNLANNMGLYLTFSSALFAFGILAALTRRNAIGIFMGVELMLNAAALNFVVFNAFQRIRPDNWLHGHVFALFIIILAAIEAAVALAIVLRIFAIKRNIDPERATELKG
jgi:NADH-quinone oxidoreductase subunit K